MMHTAGELMTSPAESIHATATVAEALDAMRGRVIASLLVRPAPPDGEWGIVTKRDVLTKVVVRDLDPESLGVRDIMSAPLVTVRAHWGVEEIAALMTAAGIRRVAVQRGEDIVGVVSDTDVFLAVAGGDWKAARLDRKARAMQRAASQATAATVADLMSSPVLTTAPDASVRQAMTVMLQHGVSSLIVDPEPPRGAGIVTKRDVITKVIAKGRDPAMLRVREILSAPLRTIAPEAGIEECSAHMASMRVRRLPVAREGEVIGIVSDTDILAAVEERRWRGRRRRRPALHVVADVMRRPAATIAADAPVADALTMMKDLETTGLLVLPERAGRAWGLVTQHDILTRVIARRQDPRTVRVAEVASRDVPSVEPETPLWECSDRMVASGAFLLPVAQGGAAIGMISDADIFRAVEERAWGVD